jgi:peptidoglycan/xylan/chitin deacetylase (PgdA/CDA1 family)
VPRGEAVTPRFDHLKARIKSWLGWLIFHLGLHRRLMRGRAIIALFHRVDDRYAGNPLTSTREEFAAYLKFFRRFYTVISLGEFLARLARGDDISGCLVITFDDGYLDNFREAAPLLAGEGLPACFFVATEFVGSELQPWWDHELGVRAEWMDWEQIRSLHQQGFEIGAHTMNHVELGAALHGEHGFAEISGSKQRLEQELGAKVDHFSYPFGRRDQMTDEHRSAVRRAGFACCLSAFGGAVRAGDDPYRLNRTPISRWFQSPYHFGFESAFDRT